MSFGMKDILAQIRGSVKGVILSLAILNAFFLGLSYQLEDLDFTPIYLKAEELPQGKREVVVVESAPVAPKMDYVASKNGTRYYLMTCGGVGRIKEENMVYFKTSTEAREAGYTPAKNCPGID